MLLSGASMFFLTIYPFHTDAIMRQMKITKLRFGPLGTMNFWGEFHGNLSHEYSDQLPDRQTVLSIESCHRRDKSNSNEVRRASSSDVISAVQTRTVLHVRLLYEDFLKTLWHNTDAAAFIAEVELWPDEARVLSLQCAHRATFKCFMAF